MEPSPQQLDYTASDRTAFGRSTLSLSLTATGLPLFGAIVLLRRWAGDVPMIAVVGVFLVYMAATFGGLTCALLALVRERPRKRAVVALAASIGLFTVLGLLSQVVFTK